MEEELISLIHSYSKNNKMVDKSYITSVFNILESYYGLNTKIIFIPSINNEMATYNIRRNTIRIYSYLTNNYEDIINKKNIDNKNFYYIFIIRIILHEMEHAKQMNFIRYTDSTEGYILQEELKTDRKFLNEVKDEKEKIQLWTDRYHEVYNYCPTEKYAEVDALNKSITIAKYLEDEEATLMFKKRYYTHLLNGYDKYEEPTKHYFEVMNSNSNFDKIDESSKGLDLAVRTRLGLKSNSYYLEDLKNKQQKVLKKLVLYKNN